MNSKKLYFFKQVAIFVWVIHSCGTVQTECVLHSYPGHDWILEVSCLRAAHVNILFCFQKAEHATWKNPVYLEHSSM